MECSQGDAEAVFTLTIPLMSFKTQDIGDPKNLRYV